MTELWFLNNKKDFCNMTVEFVTGVLTTFYYLFIFCATSALVFAAIVDYRHSGNQKMQFSECTKESDSDIECDKDCRENVENIAKKNYF